VLAALVAAGLGAAIVAATGAPAAERERLERELSEAITRDALAGLSNRQTFRLAVDAALERAAVGRPVAVLLFDLNGFKLLNDTLGPDCGDELLRALAARVVAGSPQGATVARLGGDEFAVLAEGLGGGAAVDLGDRLLRRLAEPLTAGGRRLRVGASAGVVVDAGEGRNGDTLIRDAGVAVYVAKSSGGGCREHLEGMSSELGDPVALDHDLRAALAAGELEVHYQPQFDTLHGRAAAAEALVRWHSPQRGDVPPARFVAVAERSDLIFELGAFVLASACRQTAEWLRAGLLPDGFRVWVNVSCRQLIAGDLAAQVGRTLAETGLPAERLGLEVTETSVVRGGEGAAAQLEQVRATGVRVAIDDFGTGYSSMAQLTQLPVDVLKVDRAFVGELGSNPTSEAILENILHLAAVLGLDVVVEGIEWDCQLATIRRLGCRLAQGYLLARPAPAAQLTRALTASPPDGYPNVNE